jgi:peptidyl-prolyl cis-trans isomerase SurA
VNYLLRLICAGVCALSLFLVAAAPLRAEILNRVIAVVNGEMISLHALQTAAAPELLRLGISHGSPGVDARRDAVYRRVLDAMIADILIIQEAERLAFELAPEEVENEIRAIAQRNQMSMSVFEQQLNAQGTSISTLRDQIRKDILRHRLTTMMITRRVIITQRDIQAYYEEHKALFVRDQTVELAMLIFPPHADAPALLQEIRSGQAAFADMAVQWSTGPTAAQGGGIGSLSWRDLSLEWRSALEGLEKGDVSNLITAVGGSRIALRVLDITPGTQLSLEEAAPEIELRLHQPMLEQRAEEYITQLRDRAVVDIRL